MEPVRVLQISNGMGRGGLETMLMNYYRHMDRAKVQFNFLLHGGGRGAYEDEIESLGGKIYRTERIWPKKLGGYLKKTGHFFEMHK